MNESIKRRGDVEIRRVLPIGVFVYATVYSVLHYHHRFVLFFQVQISLMVVTSLVRVVYLYWSCDSASAKVSRLIGWVGGW